MIQLKSKVNKAEIMRQLKTDALKRYDLAWQGHLRSKDFLDGVEELFKILTIKQDK